MPSLPGALPLARESMALLSSSIVGGSSKLYHDWQGPRVLHCCVSHRLRVCYFCEMPSLFHGANNFYWSCGGQCKSYYDATLLYVFRVCTVLGCLFRTRSIHKGRNYFLEGEYRFCQVQVLFFWTENLTCLDSLTPVHLVVVQLSLLTCNMFVISFGIPARPPKLTFAIESFSSVLESSHVK